MTPLDDNNESILARARQIMVENDRGGYTVPTAGLYPYQWNWDSAFAVLGFACFDRERAWLEIDTLLEGQWDDGMVPHIIFRRDDPDYFPGPTVWAAGHNPPSTGISQPPVLASVVRYLVDTGDATDRDKAIARFPKLFAWHQWFHAFRDRDGNGVIGVVHPWESGRDNCPDWDGGMRGVNVANDLGEYHRRDTGHIDASERPTQSEYDRYLTIVKFGREHGWDQNELVHNGPFFVADPGMQFILMRADRDLRELAISFGENTAAAKLDSWIELAMQGCDALWNPEVNCYCARDLKTGEFSDGITNAGMLAFYAGAGDRRQQEQLFEHADAILARVEFGFPSWDPRHPAFEAKRYWRGPVWLMMNYMIADGFANYGRDDLASRLRDDSQRLVDNYDFFEYFDPLTGTGCGGGDFTWTAAIRLVWQ